MDFSSTAHFLFSAVIPSAWLVLLLPFSHSLFKGWPNLLLTVISLSLAAAIAKEWLDVTPSLNDIAADLLGTFLGSAAISYRFLRRARALNRVPDRTIGGHRISLRGSLQLIEAVERQSAAFYTGAAARQGATAAGDLCLLLARDSRKRANRIGFLLATWRRRPPPPGLQDTLHRLFSAHELFSVALPEGASPELVLREALAHEKRKLALFEKLGHAFHDDWKAIQFRVPLDQLANEVEKLHYCAAALERLKADPGSRPQRPRAAQGE